MESFNELFNQYLQRSGISDAELARTIGVSRQTIFRWREGLTGRPRNRDDVLVIARKLRLTPDERDKLLLAAGFRPEQALVEEAAEAILEPKPPTPQGNEAETLESTPFLAETSPVSTLMANFNEGGLEAAPPQQSTMIDEAEKEQRPLLDARLLIGGLGALVVVVGLILGGDRLVSGLFPAATPDPNLPSRSGVDETVVLVTHFANYASEPIGYNVAGRLTEALQREIDDIQLENIRVESWTEPVDEREAALQVGRALSATLVIYGQYDAGRVVVEFAHPPDQNIFADPALRQHVVSLEDLSAAINRDLPHQVRSLALIALGQIFLNQDLADQARPLLLQAHDNLENDPAVEAKTLGLVTFYLGLAYHRGHLPNLDQAIEAYGQAINHWPQMISSRLNRIAAYEERNQPGDLALALGDADAIIAAKPDWGLAYNNRASIRLTMGGRENLDLALADLNQALALDAERPEVYLNRASVQFGQGFDLDAVRPDIEKALELRADYGNAYNLLCWGYGLEQQAETALPFCQLAVAAEPEEPLFVDSRGLTYALLGDQAAAIADFTLYAEWLEATEAGPNWKRDLKRRRTWIEALEQGENPFTPQILSLLREEVGQ